MSRAGYYEDCGDVWRAIMWRGAVTSAIRGARGQAFLRELIETLDAMPEKKLVAGVLKDGDCVCALGSVGARRGLPLEEINPEDHDTIAKTLGVSPAFVRQVAYENDEGTFYKEAPEDRWKRMRKWAESQLNRAA